MSELSNKAFDPAALRRRAEERAQKQAPMAGPETLGPEACHRLIHELRVHQIELEMQNEEVCRTQAAFVTMRAHYFELFDLAPVAYCTVSEAGALQEVNLAAATLLGVPKEELVSQPLTRFIHQEDQDLYYQMRKRLVASGAPQACEVRLKQADGIRCWVHVAATRVAKAGGTPVQHMVLSDIRERKLREDERAHTAQLIALLSAPGDVRARLETLTAALQGWSGCEAVGIRLRSGDDYPYYETRGFPPEFVQKENQLCAVGPDGKLLCDAAGHPILECMCGNILCGRFDPAKPFFTAQGSFWTNSTSALLAATTPTERMARTRNYCHTAGYESVALIPLRDGQQVFGLLQFNDRRMNCFTPELIAHFERMADSFAMAWARRQVEESLRESQAILQAAMDQSQAGIAIAEAPSGRLRYVNKAGLFIRGGSHAELVNGVDINQYVGSWQLLDLDGTPLATDAVPLARAIRYGEASSREFIIRRAEQDDRTVLANAAPIRDAQGAVTAAMVVFQDITERKRAEAALEQRLVALTQPLDSVAGVAFTDLFRLEDIQRLQDEFASATGVASIITHPDGTPITAPSNFCRLCRDVIRQSDKGRVNCFRSDAMLGRASAVGPTIQTCLSGGLWDAGAGITVGGKHLANWLIGQVRDETQSEEKLRTYAREIGADEEVTVAAFLEVPAMSREKFGLIAQALFTLANQLSTIAYQNVQQARFIEERKRAEETLRQSEKMRAIGQLAGGVAHDFNNQLGGIVGFADLLVENLADPTLKGYADNIIKAAMRATELTRQLLAFSRKGKYVSVPTDVHQVIGEVVEILQRSIDKRIEILQHLEAQPSNVLGDSAQLQNAILNLALNARDAMPQGGTLMFATRVVPFSEIKPVEDLAPGPYVRICITDTGIGMDAAIQKRLFEPFFTTKAVGKGTGLGLASVYGTVKNHGGVIRVSSEPGHGSSFYVYLPVQGAAGEAVVPEAAAPAVQAGHGRILMVDDETIILELGCTMLRKKGYEVTTCHDPLEALQRYRQEWQSIDLVILDMVMPQMGGRELFLALREINPKIRALLSSGYSINGEAQGILNLGVLAFVPKPFRLSELAQQVGKALVGK
jgi:PAS domain S-box-containing protein